MTHKGKSNTSYCLLAFTNKTPFLLPANKTKRKTKLLKAWVASREALCLMSHGSTILPLMGDTSSSTPCCLSLPQSRTHSDQNYQPICASSHFHLLRSVFLLLSLLSFLTELRNFYWCHLRDFSRDFFWEWFLNCCFLLLLWSFRLKICSFHLHLASLFPSPSRLSPHQMILVSDYLVRYQNFID